MAMETNNLATAYELVISCPSEDKWQQLGKLAYANQKYDLAQNCHEHKIGHIKGKVLR